MRTVRTTLKRCFETTSITFTEGHIDDKSLGKISRSKCSFFFQRNSDLNWWELSRCSVRMLTSPCRWMTLNNGVLFWHPSNTASASYALWKKMSSVLLHKFNQLSVSILNVCETFLSVAPTPTPLKNVVPRLIWITLSNETIQNYWNINRIRAQGFKHFAVKI